MRTIKFRAWDVHNKKIIFPAHFSTNEHGGLNFSSMELMQYTGLHDKNGKEIYEGDIINLPDYQFNPVQASFMQGVFGVTGADSVHYPLRAFSKTGSSSIEIESPVEVIGNIYEHKHLLK